MTPEETAAAARRLDDFLHEAARKTRMPEIGGRKLAGNFKALIAKVKGDVEAAHGELQSALGEFSEQADAAKQVARQIRSEAAEMRTALGEVLGNDPPSDTQGTGIGTNQNGGDSGRG